VGRRRSTLCRRALGIAATIACAAFVAACSTPPTTPQAQAPAGQSSAAQNTSAPPTPSPTAAPTPQLLDACKLLTPDDVAAMLGPGAPVAIFYVSLQPTLSFGTGSPIPAPSGVSCNYTSTTPTAPGASFTPPGLVSLRLCRCNASSAEFESWALKSAVVGNFLAGEMPQPIPSVGERAYLLPGGRGIAFRQSGVDFVLTSSSLPELRQTTGPVNSFSGQRPPLPEAEMTSKATAFFSAVAAKILGRLAASPAAAPSVVACSAGIPTVTLPAGFTFNNCREQPAETAYTWCPTSGGGGCLTLRRRPFGPVSLAGDAVDINGSVGRVQAQPSTTFIGWYDNGLSWQVDLSSTLLSRDALLAFARSVRPELVAVPTPGPAGGAPVISTTGRCATTPTITLPADFVFLQCTERGTVASHTWSASGRGSFTLSSLVGSTPFTIPGGTTVDVNGRDGSIASQGGATEVWLMGWTVGTTQYAIGASGMSREAVIAAARSVR
jgi:hypothetical protein